MPNDAAYERKLPCKSDLCNDEANDGPMSGKRDVLYSRAGPECQLDNVDLKAATEHGVIVSNVPNYAFDSVAVFVFALALDLLRKVHVADMNLRKG